MLRQSQPEKWADYDPVGFAHRRKQEHLLVLWGETGHCAALDPRSPSCWLYLSDQKKRKVSHSPTHFLSLVLLISGSPSLKGWIHIIVCSINQNLSQQLKKTLWCDFNLALTIEDRRSAQAAAVDMLHLCFWEKNDICLILIPGAVSGKKNRGLAWQKKKLLLSAKLVLFSAHFFSLL